MPKRYKANFNEMFNVGKARYVVNYHDGKKTHPDRSPFYDIHISKNKREHERFVKSLRSQGYVDRSSGLALTVG